MKLFVLQCVMCSLLVPNLLLAADADRQNVTALVGKQSAGAESYVLSLRAPKIDGAVFPVPVRYFDDLVNDTKKLQATLNVPLRLSIRNSRKRRLLTVFTIAGNNDLPYGSSLREMRQVKIGNYHDAQIKKIVLQTFVGPNKMIFRTKEDAKNYDIDFVLPVTAKHFHQGYVKVAIGSSNGEELTQVCEISNANCMQAVTFHIVPRVVEYSYSGMDLSSISMLKPTAGIEITKSNVDVSLHINNQRIALVKRSQVPFKHAVNFVVRQYNPHLVVKQKEDVYVSNVDIYPIIHYMSNNSYAKRDVVVGTFLHERPDLHIKMRSKGADLTTKLDDQIN